MNSAVELGVSKDSREDGSQHCVERALWTALATEPTASRREAIFSHYLPYARAIAAQLYAGRHRDDVEFKDFLQLACIGLLESIDRFEPDRGILFRTFCTPRIRGNVLAGITRLSDGQEQASLQRRMRRERVASLEQGDESGNRSFDTFQTLAMLTVG